MDTQEIAAVHSILHLVYHRNKNQHQRAKWWKWLAILKRSTADLRSVDSVAALARYQQHLAAHLVPRCYLAFSTVVADNQFSTLGVTLLAALARLAKATGADRKLDAKPRLKAKAKTGSVPVSTEDRGERISRDDPNTLPVLTQSHQLSSKERSSTKKIHSAKSTKKTSKQKKNVIDDLFSGLL
ncbi:hypothetical protein N7478_005270 [Penicillium angulare]|uniref:uncharacterized protein n=1 Tax=Penicillium angulare TaxID=116970 RepID=UPI0025413B95|nr:uncharacterized protein N7478_005270 [Penicillium angulare]KAJ5279898.1 hypothetical protein N7478_005270 [Penicillium angulare]